MIGLSACTLVGHLADCASTPRHGRRAFEYKHGLSCVLSHELVLGLPLPNTGLVHPLLPALLKMRLQLCIMLRVPLVNATAKVLGAGAGPLVAQIYCQDVAAADSSQLLVP